MWGCWNLPSSWAWGADAFVLLSSSHVSSPLHTARCVAEILNGPPSHPPTAVLSAGNAKHLTAQALLRPFVPNQLADGVYRAQGEHSPFRGQGHFSSGGLGAVVL